MTDEEFFEMWVAKPSHVSDIKRKAMGNLMAFLIFGAIAAKQYINLINK